MIKRWTPTFLLFLFAVSASQAADNIKAFPPAEEGMIRYVLRLPKEADESAYQVRSKTFLSSVPISETAFLAMGTSARKFRKAWII